MSKLLLAKNTNQAKSLSRLCRAQKLRRIYQGIYTDNLQTPITEIALHHWLDIVSHIVSKGILSYRTAIDLQPTPFKGQAIVFMTSSYAKTIVIPGLTIKVLKGNNHAYVEQVLPGIARSNIPRMLLENLTTVRAAQYKNIKTIGVDGVENFLAKELRLRNGNSLNKIRDEAKIIAAKLGYTSAYKTLKQTISALLSTHPNPEFFNEKYGNTIAKTKPYDRKRIKLFENLSIYLKKCRFKNREYEYSKISFKTLAFFESYFSNFIEGTEFIIDEAEDIVFKGVEINHRHADSHDVLSNFSLSNDYSEMNVTPGNPNELLDIIKNRHAYLMKERPEKRPGQFKEKANKAGNTYFVEPDEVTGTLLHSFDIYHLLNDGIEKALFIHLLISEVHPFTDGNGRLSRIMMNAELVRSELFKVIIPSSYRDNYLNGLRLASRDNNFHTYCKSIDLAQAYTSSINWLDYGQAREKIEADHANLTPDEGLPILNRALRKLTLSDFA